MDRSAVKAVVERELPELQRRFGLGHVTITVEYGPRENPQHEADCGRNCNYNTAIIGFDPEKTKDETELVENLRHELFHVVLTPFDLLWHLMTVGLVGDDMIRAERLWTFSAEQTVIALERLHAGLTEAPKRKR